MHVLILVLLYASMAQAWNIIGGATAGRPPSGTPCSSASAPTGGHGRRHLRPSRPGALVGIVAAAAVAVLISYPCFKLSGHYFAIATFAIVR